jgi:hypothetical protein
MQTYLPEVRDKPHIQIRQPITRHDIFQQQLIWALNNHPLEMAEWLAGFLPGLKGRLSLLPQMREVADTLEQLVNGLDIVAVIGSADSDPALIETLSLLWEKKSIPLLREKIEQLRNFQLKFDAEVPVTEFASTNSQLSIFQPPTGYIDLLVDLDTPFVRVPNVAPVFTHDTFSSDMLRNTASHMALGTGILRLEALFLPLGHALNLNKPEGKRQADTILESLQRHPDVKIFLAAFEALLKERYARFSQHEYLFVEIKMACPPPDDLIKQVNKYPPVQAFQISSDTLFPMGVSNNGADNGAELKGPMVLSHGMTRRIWNYGLPAGERWDRPARYAEMEFGWIHTHVALLFPGKYHHSGLLHKAGLIVIEDMSSVMDSLLSSGRDA